MAAGQAGAKALSVATLPGRRERPPAAAELARPARSTGSSGRVAPDPGALLLGWAGLSWGIAHVNGWYSVVSISLMLAGCACVLGGVLVPRAFPVATLPVALGLVGGVELATPFAHFQVHHPGASGAWWWAAVALAGAATIGAGALILLRLAGRAGRAGRVPLPWVVGLAIAADLAVILSCPDPGIDVFTILSDSSHGLLHGQDLYRQTWPHSTGLTDTYPYLPGTTLLVLPGWLLGDVRLADVVALGVAGLLALRLARPTSRTTGGRTDPATGAGGRSRLLAHCAPVLPLLIVAYPRSVLPTEWAWTEPLLLVLILGMVVAVRTGHGRTAVVCLGLALASKQHIALLLPLAAWWPAFGPRRALASLGVALAVVTPWLIAGPGDFWHDAVTTTLGFPVLPDAMDIPAILAHHRVVAGFWLLAGGLALSYLLVWRRLPRTGEGFVAGCALVLLAVDACNKQTFFNHWSLVTALLVVAVVLHDQPDPG